MLIPTALQSCPHKVPVCGPWRPVITACGRLASSGRFSCTFSSPGVRTEAPPIAAQPPRPGPAPNAPWVEVWVRLVHDGKYLRSPQAPLLARHTWAVTRPSPNYKKGGKLEGMDALALTVLVPSVTIKGKVRRQQIHVCKTCKSDREENTELDWRH